MTWMPPVIAGVGIVTFTMLISPKPPGPVTLAVMLCLLVALVVAAVAP